MNLTPYFSAHAVCTYAICRSLLVWALQFSTLSLRIGTVDMWHVDNVMYEAQNCYFSLCISNNDPFRNLVSHCLPLRDHVTAQYPCEHIIVVFALFLLSNPLKPVVPVAFPYIICFTNESGHESIPTSCTKRQVHDWSPGTMRNGQKYGYWKV